MTTQYKRFLNACTLFEMFAGVLFLVCRSLSYLFSNRVLTFCEPHRVFYLRTEQKSEMDVQQSGTDVQVLVI